MIVIEQNLDGFSSSALERFARGAQKLAGVRGEVAVLVAGRRRIQELNRRFRHKDKPTDVLSFPRQNGAGGDIAICAPIALENARRFGHSAAQELKVLVLHGMLHLAGYDHETDQGQMARQEARLREQLKLPVSLIERTDASARRNAAPARKSRRTAQPHASQAGRARSKQ